MPKATQLILSLKSKRGVLASVAHALAEAGVNITALHAGEASGRGKIGILVNNATKAKRALRAAKYKAREEPAFIVRVRNKPGRLARVAERLAQARINIKSAYATTSGRGGATVVFTVSNPAKARRILR